MTNPKAGHTSATGMGSNASGLRDGDGLTSPSLTNLYEGIHGNGIMRLGDGAKGDSLRNSIVANTPGFIEITATQGEIKVYGGYCVLDGVLYKFANGPGSHETFVVGTTGAGANHSGDLPSVPASNSDVFVTVFLVGRNTPEAHVMYEMGTPAAPSSGTPLIPNRFLSDPRISGNSDLNHQTTVLGVIRYTMTGGAGSITASLNSSPVVHDRRTFLRTSPLYLTPMTQGSIGNVDAGNVLSNPDSFFTSPENGNLSGSTFGAIWQTHREDVAGNKHALILATSPRNLNTTPVTSTHVLGPNRFEEITTSGNVTFTYDEGNVWIVTTDAARTINPSGTFPVGHIVEVYHKAGSHTLHFDSTSGGHSTGTKINVDIGEGEYGKFIYDGADWHQLNLNGGSGSGTVTSIATTAPITGGTITTTGTIGINAATTSAAGSMSSADKTKLDAIPTTRAHMFAKITTPGSALTSTVPAVIQHSTTEYDENSDFDASDYAFVAPRDGYYLVSVGFYLNLTPTWSFSMVYKSTDGGSTYPDIVVREVSGSGQKNQLTTVVKLDANDRLRHYANASFSSGTYQVQSGNTALTYFRVSELI
jgi:hypothetical protein